jgi:hypothetical protein
MHTNNILLVGISVPAVSIKMKSNSLTLLLELLDGEPTLAILAAAAFTGVFLNPLFVGVTTATGACLAVNDFVAMHIPGV